MYRFKASKYKNATPKVPKKGEGWILDISVGSPLSYGNHVKASAAFMAFNIDSRGGGSLGVLPLDACGRKSRNLPSLHAHSELITDFDFSPFDDGLLATGSEDRHVKVWRIPSDGTVPLNPEITLPSACHKVERVLFHPTVDSVLTMALNKCVRLWDVTQLKNISEFHAHQDVVQSISWREDGSVLVSSSRDKFLRILDPRSEKVAQETKSHANCRDTRVLWLGNSDRILSTGFGSAREKEVILRDIRNFDKQLSSFSGESSSGVLIPLFDPDTNMLFLSAKGDTTVAFWEVAEKDPHLSECSRYVGDVQMKGICLVPKRAMKVMEGEVNRVLLLGQDCIVPITYQVPRKSYRDYHAELFPDTKGPNPSMLLEEWLNGANEQVDKVSLDPSKHSGLVKFGHQLGTKGPVMKDSNDNKTSTERKDELEATNTKNDNSNEGRTGELGTKTAGSARIISYQKKNNNETKTEDSVQIPKKPPIASKPSQISSMKASNASSCNGLNTANELKRPEPSVQNKAAVAAPPSSAPPAEPQPQPAEQPRRGPRGFAVRTTKFRHLKGTILHKETHITNLSNLSRTVPGECDMFHANRDRVAVPLSGAGGRIAILEVTSSGRRGTGVLPSIICGSAVMDFAWNPFDNYQLATGLDTGDIQLWKIPENGLSTSITDPEAVIRGHTDKVTIIKFHPLAKDVLASASQDLSIRIWDLATQEEKLRLEGHTEQIFSIAWNSNGNWLATVAKDQKVRLYEPRVSQNPVKEGPGPQGVRGARILWVLKDTHFVVTGFSRVSERQISLYDASNPSTVVTVESLDVSPAILIPYYDEDSSTLFVTGKGDATVYTYEVATDAPYLHQLSHSKFGSSHQAISFLPKNACNVSDVEFARAYRMTTSTIEPVSFTVPRLRAEFFQDDLFPPTRVTWEPTCNSSQWFSGMDCEPQRVSLRPDGMAALSGAPEIKKAPKQSSPHSNDVPIRFEGDVVLEGSLAFLRANKEKEERIVSAMMEKMVFSDEALPQDSYEGVDPSEWNEDEH